MCFYEATVHSHSGNLWLGFEAQGAYWLIVKASEWGSQNSFLSLCMMFTYFPFSKPWDGFCLWTPVTTEHK